MAGESTDQSKTEGLEIHCDVLVDYLNQARKPTKAKHTSVFLQRDEFKNIIMVIGTTKQRQIFKLEDIAKIYSPKATDATKDKASFEMNLPGGSVCNVMLQNITPLEFVKPFLDICQKIYNDPYSASTIELIQT